MTILNPVNTETSKTVIASEVANALQSQIDILNNQISQLNANIEDLETALGSPSITKSGGTFQSLTSTTANITNLNANDATISHIETPKIEATCVVADNANVQDASLGNVSSNSITSNEANIDDLTARHASITCGDITNLNATNGLVNSLSAESLNTPSANVSNLQAQSISGLQALSIDELHTNTQDVDELTADEATLSKLKSTYAEITTLYNQIRAFGENDEKKPHIVVEPFNNGSDANNDPVWIELDPMSSAFYRVELKENNVGNQDEGVLFSVIYTQTATTPVIQWSKEHNGDIDKFVYDRATNKFYISTYASGNLYWSSDAADIKGAPKTYAELPCDIMAETTMLYTAARHHGVLIMGDNSIDYGLTIQGVLEAKVIKEATKYHVLFVYCDNWIALKKFADSYLRYEEASQPGTWHYLKSETSGYLYHKDDSYRDSDNTEVEAVEKIEYDGTNVTLTIDNKYGQDEIEINSATSGEYTVTLPADSYYYTEGGTRYIKYTLPAGTYDDCEIPSDVEIKFEYGQTAVVHEPIPETDYALEIIPGGAGPTDVINIVDSSSQTVLVDVSHDVQIWQQDYIANDVEVSIEATEQKTVTINSFNYVIETANGAIVSAYLTSPLGNIDVTSSSTIAAPTPMSETLPFIIDLMLASRPWSEAMNQDVFNGDYGKE